MGQIEEVLGITCTAADKADKKGGIQDVADRLVRQADGKPRLMLFRDALVHQADPELLATGKPTKTESEFDSYVWNPRLAKCEEPIKEHDHGMDALRYLCRHLSDQKPGRNFDGYGVPEVKKVKW